jgi:hypothetical protein
MISSQDQDQNAQSNQGNDKSLSSDDRSSGEARHTNECGSLDAPSYKEFLHLKVRVHLHDDNDDNDDKEFHFPPGITAVEPPIDANPGPAIHQRHGISNDRPAVGRRLFRTVTFGVMTAVIVGAAFAWQFYRDGQTKDMVRGLGTSPKELSPVVSANFWPSSSDLAAEFAFKTSDRVPTQDTALLQAVSVLPSAQVSVAPGSPPELQHQLETMVSDIAVVRRIVERLAALQEQMAQDIVTLQKSGQNVRQKVSLPPHSPAAVPPRKYAPSMSLPPHSPAAVPPRKYAPSIARSDVVAHSPSVPVRTAPAQPPLAPH